jgi:type IV secretory pathway VirB2 component (pilin)
MKSSNTVATLDHAETRNNKSGVKRDMKPYYFAVFLALVTAVGLMAPDLAHAGLESSLMGIKTKLTGVILPLLSVIGIAIAAISFFTGNPNAKQHIVYAVLGCIFGFGAQAIVDFIAQTVR